MPGRPLTLRTNLRMPSLSIHSVPNDSKQETRTLQRETRKNPFTFQDLMKAWQTFIDTHPTEHVLINTMRSCRPASDIPEDQKVEQATYQVIVDNDIQVDELNNRMDEILTHISDALSNDMITFKVRANDGPASPQTWNESQILESMVTNHPDFADFITALALTRY